MSVTISNSPFHDTAIITYPYGIADSGYSCGWHTGLDLVGLNNIDIYSVSSGTVVQINTNPANSLGVFVVIQAVNGNYFRYCHMVENSVVVSLGQSVGITTKIGVMGSTGTHVTGAHLHLEYSSTLTWQCDTFMNPCEYLNIPNVDDTIIYYEPQPTPIFTTGKSKFPWVLFAKKLRNKRG